MIKPETSEKMRYLMRLNVEKGTATRADVKGYYVGGKTGTSEKVVAGRYSKTKVLTAFTAVLPADRPRYGLLIMLDEPQPTPETPRLCDLGLERGAGRRRGDRRASRRCSGSSRATTCRTSDKLILASARALVARSIGRVAGAIASMQVGCSCMKAASVDASAVTRGSRAGHEACRSHSPPMPSATRASPRSTSRGVSADSRAVKPGDLFVAVAGAKDDGMRFVGQALAAGAAAVMAERAPPTPLPAGVAFVKVGNARRALALAAAKFFPRQPRVIAAVTGTSGKTSVAAFTRQIWAALGEQAASIGTVGLVTPDARDLRLAHHARSGGAARARSTSSPARA